MLVNQILLDKFYSKCFNSLFWKIINLLIDFLTDVVDEDMLLTLAHQNYKAGNYKQVLEHSKAVYERNPRRTDNLLLLGATYYQVAIWLLCLLPIYLTLVFYL